MTIQNVQHVANSLGMLMRRNRLALQESSSISKFLKPARLYIKYADPKELKAPLANLETYLSALEAEHKTTGNTLSVLPPLPLTGNHTSWRVIMMYLHAIGKTAKSAEKFISSSTKRNQDLLLKSIANAQALIIDRDPAGANTSAGWEELANRGLRQFSLALLAAAGEIEIAISEAVSRIATFSSRLSEDTNEDSEELELDPYIQKKAISELGGVTIQYASDDGFSALSRYTFPDSSDREAWAKVRDNLPTDIMARDPHIVSTNLAEVFVKTPSIRSAMLKFFPPNLSVEVSKTTGASILPLGELFLYTHSSYTSVCLKEHLERAKSTLVSFASMVMAFGYINSDEAALIKLAECLHGIAFLGVREPQSPGQALKQARNLYVADCALENAIGKKMSDEYYNTMSPENQRLADYIRALVSCVTTSREQRIQLCHLYKSVPHPDADLSESFNNVKGTQEPNLATPGATEMVTGQLKKQTYQSLIKQGHHVFALIPGDRGASALETQINATAPNQGAINKFPSSQWANITLQCPTFPKIGNLVLKAHDKTSQSHPSDAKQMLKDAKEYANQAILPVTSPDVPANDPMSMYDQFSFRYPTGKGAMQALRGVNDALAELNGSPFMQPNEAVQRFSTSVNTFTAFEREYMAQHPEVTDCDAIPSEAIEQHLLENLEIYPLVGTEPKLGEKHKIHTRIFYYGEQAVKSMTQTVERLARYMSKDPTVSITKNSRQARSDLEHAAATALASDSQTRPLFISFDMSQFSMKFPPALLRAYGSILADLTGVQSFRRLDLVFRTCIVLHNSRGFVDYFGGVKGGFEGFLNFAWTMIHSAIMKTALESTNYQGDLYTYSDDGLLIGLVPRGAQPAEVIKFATDIQDHYLKCGLIFNIGKTFIAWDLWEYLGAVYTAGHIMQSWGKPLSSLGELDQTSGFYTTYDRIRAMHGQYEASVGSGAPPQAVAVIAGYLSSRYLLNKFPYLASKSSALFWILALPEGAGGMGWQHPSALMYNSALHRTAEFLADLDCLLLSREEETLKVINLIMSTMATKYDAPRCLSLGALLRTNLPDCTGSKVSREILLAIKEKADLANLVTEGLSARELDALLYVFSKVQDLDLTVVRELISSIPAEASFNDSLVLAKSKAAIALLPRNALRRFQSQDTYSVKNAITSLVTCFRNGESATISKGGRASIALFNAVCTTTYPMLKLAPIRLPLRGRIQINIGKIGGDKSFNLRYEGHHLMLPEAVAIARDPSAYSDTPYVEKTANRASSVTRLYKKSHAASSVIEQGRLMFIDRIAGVMASNPQIHNILRMVAMIGGVQLPELDTTTYQRTLRRRQRTGVLTFLATTDNRFIALSKSLPPPLIAGAYSLNTTVDRSTVPGQALTLFCYGAYGGGYIAGLRMPSTLICDIPIHDTRGLHMVVPKMQPITTPGPDELTSRIRRAYEAITTSQSTIYKLDDREKQDYQASVMLVSDEIDLTTTITEAQAMTDAHILNRDAPSVNRHIIDEDMKIRIIRMISDTYRDLYNCASGANVSSLNRSSLPTHVSVVTWSMHASMGLIASFCEFIATDKGSNTLAPLLAELKGRYEEALAAYDDLPLQMSREFVASLMAYQSTVMEAISLYSTNTIPPYVTEDTLQVLNVTFLEKYAPSFTHHFFNGFRKILVPLTSSSSEGADAQKVRVMREVMTKVYDHTWTSLSSCNWDINQCTSISTKELIGRCPPDDFMDGLACCLVSLRQSRHRTADHLYNRYTAFIHWIQLRYACQWLRTERECRNIIRSQLPAPQKRTQLRTALAAYRFNAMDSAVLFSFVYEKRTQAAQSAGGTLPNNQAQVRPQAQAVSYSDTEDTIEEINASIAMAGEAMPVAPRKFGARPPVNRVTVGGFGQPHESKKNDQSQAAQKTNESTRIAQTGGVRFRAFGVLPISGQPAKAVKKPKTAQEAFASLQPGEVGYSHKYVITCPLPPKIIDRAIGIASGGFKALEAQGMKVSPLSTNEIAIEFNRFMSVTHMIYAKIMARTLNSLQFYHPPGLSTFMQQTVSTSSFLDSDGDGDIQPRAVTTGAPSPAFVTAALAELMSHGTISFLRFTSQFDRRVVDAMHNAHLISPNASYLVANPVPASSNEQAPISKRPLSSSEMREQRELKDARPISAGTFLCGSQEEAVLACGLLIIRANSIAYVHSEYDTDPAAYASIEEALKKEDPAAASQLREKCLVSFATFQPSKLARAVTFKATLDLRSSTVVHTESEVNAIGAWAHYAHMTSHETISRILESNGISMDPDEEATRLYDLAVRAPLMKSTIILPPLNLGVRNSIRPQARAFADSPPAFINAAQYFNELAGPQGKFKSWLVLISGLHLMAGQNALDPTSLIDIANSIVNILKSHAPQGGTRSQSYDYEVLIRNLVSREISAASSWLAVIGNTDTPETLELSAPIRDAFSSITVDAYEVTAKLMIYGQPIHWVAASHNFSDLEGYVNALIHAGSPAETGLFTAFRNMPLSGPQALLQKATNMLLCPAPPAEAIRDSSGIIRRLRQVGSLTHYLSDGGDTNSVSKAATLLTLAYPYSASGSGRSLASSWGTHGQLAKFEQLRSATSGKLQIRDVPNVLLEMFLMPGPLPSRVFMWAVSLSLIVLSSDRVTSPVYPITKNDIHLSALALREAERELLAVGRGESKVQEVSQNMAATDLRDLTRAIRVSDEVLHHLNSYANNIADGQADMDGIMSGYNSATGRGDLVHHWDIFLYASLDDRDRPDSGSSSDGMDQLTSGWSWADITETEEDAEFMREALGWGVSKANLAANSVGFPSGLREAEEKTGGDERRDQLGLGASDDPGGGITQRGIPDDLAFGIINLEIIRGATKKSQLVNALTSSGMTYDDANAVIARAGTAGLTVDIEDDSQMPH